MESLGLQHIINNRQTTVINSLQQTVRVHSIAKLLFCVKLSVFKMSFHISKYNYLQYTSELLLHEITPRTGIVLENQVL